MRISQKEHDKHPWLAHELLKDFEVEDVWRFPVTLQDHHSLKDFREQMMGSLEQVKEKGLPGMLFKLRFFLGRVFGWDEEPQEHAALSPGSLRERYAQANKLTADQLVPPGNKEFIPVYELENESFAEIENATVHAGLHLGKVPDQGDAFTIQMAVYVKPKGILGGAYMALIKPFRLAIVYPALLRLAGTQWKKYLKEEKEEINI